MQKQMQKLMRLKKQMPMKIISRWDDHGIV